MLRSQSARIRRIQVKPRRRARCGPVESQRTFVPERDGITPERTLWRQKSRIPTVIHPRL